jgi:DNA-binding NarL/FixJ family response regulator
VRDEATDARLGVIGRDAELAVVGASLAHGFRPALLLAGGPGIGKTTLWEAGVELAGRRGIRVLAARPSDAEARLSFAALIDLFDGVDSRELDGLPAPQLEALETALLRTAPEGQAPAERAIAVGTLNALRALSARDPILIAVDDVQWLDTSSASALAYAARRLGGEVGVLLATRPGPPAPLEQALEPLGLERLELGPLSLGATRHLLLERLGLTLPRQLLRRVVDATLGNPLFALEVGRTLLADGRPTPRADLPVPERVEDLLGTRVAGLPSPVRRLLLAVALGADLPAGLLGGLAEPGSLEQAVEAGILVVDREHVRPAHPLLAAAAIRQAPEDERRELHRALAEATADGELRALHLALATEQPDAELAASVASTAATAAVRGAREEAVALAEHALRLTPSESTDRSGRLLALAGYLEAAGEPQRVTDLLTPELDSLPPGAARVRAELLLSEGGGVTTIWEHERHLERALAEAGRDPVLRAQALAKMSSNAAATAVSRIGVAEERALEALPAARRAGAELERLVLYGLAWARSLGGHPIDDLCERFLAISDAASWITESPEHVAAQRHAWRGELDEARVELTHLLQLADERGEALSYALVRAFLCDVELRAGDWPAVSRLLDDWAQSEQILVAPTYQRVRAQVAAGRGLPDEAEHWAAQAVAGAEAIGTRWQLLEALRGRGVAAMLAHEPARGVTSLRAVWEHTEREGVEEPGAFPVAPDLVEALAGLGELDEARAVTARLERLARDQEHPWGCTSARRCEAVVRLAERYDEDAAAALERAAGEYARLGLRFDEARSLLALGRAQRRSRKWGAARATLQRAAASFDELASPGWADAARSELARVGARRPSRAGELTPAERRVAELAADGLANKEIAQTLVVTVSTVEYHLRNVYEKLGVRSRAQLASRLAGGAQGRAPGP